MSESKHTPGPWGWFGSTRTYMYLATQHSGRRFVMGFKRKGLNGAEPTFQIDSVMVPASELAIYEVNRKATEKNDPSLYRHDIVGFRSADATLIAAAPELLEALTELLNCPDIADSDDKDEETHAAERKARDAIAKATTPTPPLSGRER